MRMSDTPTLVAGRYRVLGPLGSGGVAVVLLAEDQRLGRRVAMKRLRAESPAELARRFEHEASLGASLDHRNIVAVFDTLCDDHGFVIIMEYVAGQTLAQAIARRKLDAERSLAVLRGLAAALDYAHGHGIVHRDVKPANVLLGQGGVVKLADLGVATAADGHNAHSRMVVGTPAYMAPEQLRGALGGPAVDIFALGTVAYEVLSGRRARAGKRSARELANLVYEPPPDLRMVDPTAPRAAARLLQRAMAHDPLERPQSATEFVADLAEALCSRPKTASIRVAEPPQRTDDRRLLRRRGYFWGTAAIATLALGAGLLFGLHSGRMAAKGTSASGAAPTYATPSAAPGAAG